MRAETGSASPTFPTIARRRTYSQRNELFLWPALGSFQITATTRPMTNRRDFLKAAAAAAAVASLGSRAQAGTLRPPPSGSDPFIDDLALEGLNAAKAAGASYADT